MISVRPMPELALNELEDYGQQSKKGNRFSLFGYVIDAKGIEHPGDVPGQVSKLAPYYGKPVDKVFEPGGKHALKSQASIHRLLGPHIIGILSQEAQAELAKKKQVVEPQIVSSVCKL